MKFFPQYKAAITTLLTPLLIGSLMAAQAYAANLTRESVSSDEAQGNGYSFDFNINRDGRYVAFESESSNLVPNDTNQTTDIFLRDRQQGTTTLVSVDSSGQSASGTSFSPSISADGRYVAFISTFNFDSRDTNSFFDVYVRDMQAGTTTWASVNLGSGLVGEDARFPQLSADGRYIAYQSTPQNIDNSPRIAQIYLRDLQSSTTTIVSKAVAGSAGNRDSAHASISADGNFIAFTSEANNLIDNDTNDESDIFVYERATGHLRRASVSESGSQLSGASFTPSLNADGRYLVFASLSDDVVSGDTNGHTDVFLRDLQREQTTRISIPVDATHQFFDAGDPDINDDGRYITFSGLLKPAPTDQSNTPQIFVFDRKLSFTQVVSLNLGGKYTLGAGQRSRISGNGRFIGFVSNANDLVPRDTNNRSDVFVSDRNGAGYKIPLSISDATTKEYNEGMISLSFVVTLDSPSSTPITVRYTTFDGTAKAPADYAATAGTLTFQARETRTVISVPVQGDAADEKDEFFRINLSQPTGADIGDGQAVGTILDDDLPPTLSVDNVTVTEDTDKAATFNVTLSAPSAQTVSVNATPYNGTAKAPDDYVSGGAAITFTPGETSKTFSVPIIGDLLNETDETLYVILSSPVNCSLGKGRGTGTILNDDALPSVSIDDARVVEGNSGQKAAVFPLHLSAPSGTKVRVFYTTDSNLSARDDDYVPVTGGIVDFNTGSTSAYVRISINGDTLDELDEQFTVSISAQNAAVGDAGARCTILNDDRAPAISISDVSITEGNGGARDMVFLVELSAPSGKTVEVSYKTADGTAKNGSDYVTATGTLVLPGGYTTTAVRIPITGDVVFESDEKLYVLLSNPYNASIAKARGVGTIANDDSSG